jgi:ArsR family transcriptional regulator
LVNGLAPTRSIHQDRLVHRLPVSCCTPVAGSSLAESDAVELERLLRSIADRHRLKILNMLVRAGAPVCVCEFTAAFELPQQNVSYHLKQLVAAGVVARERRGRYSYYSLVEGALDHIAALVSGPDEQAAAA